MGTLSSISDVRQRLEMTPSHLPEGLVFLPRNFFSCIDSSEFIYSVHAPTFCTLFRNAGYSTSYLFTPDERRYQDNRAADWIAPILFIPSSVLRDNPAFASIAYGIISNYLSNLFIHDPQSVVEVELDVERPSEIKRFRYKGPVEGLQAAESLLKDL